MRAFGAQRPQRQRCRALNSLDDLHELQNIFTAGDVEPVCARRRHTTTVERWGERGPIVLAVHGMTSSRNPGSGSRAFGRPLSHGRLRSARPRRQPRVTGPMALTAACGTWTTSSRCRNRSTCSPVTPGAGRRVLAAAHCRPPRRRDGSDDPPSDGQWYDEYLEELREQFELIGEARDAAVRAEYGDWDPLDVAGKVHAVHAMTSEPIERLRAENAPSTWDLQPTIAGFTRPLLLAMAAPGESINDDETLAHVAQHHSPSVAIHSFPGGGHNLHRTDFRAFARTLDEFLTRTD